MRRQGIRMGVGLGGLAIALVSWPVAVWAEPLAREDVPEPLQPWIDWVLIGHEEQRCPFLQGEGTRTCVWPGRLSLTLSGEGGRFEHEVFVARASDVSLPGGDGPVWPQEVTVDGRRAAVVDLDGGPRVRLEPGLHRIEGRLPWSALPPGLRVPSEIGLVELSVAGARVAEPRRDAAGTLWLRDADAPAQSAPTENRVEVEVARRFEDAVPPRLESSVRLRVSGETREELLGVALPTDWLATALDSPLPARLDPDGRLRVQVRPGEWTLRIAARLAKPALRFAPPKQPKDARWDDSEVWSIALAPELRLVELTGAPSIDPTQAEIPGDWHALPTFRLDAASVLEFVEKRRGNEGSQGDQLTLARTWYLDFDGAGATVIDQLSGTLRRSLRLEMGDGTELGRVAVGGVDQPITRRKENDRLGIETALGQLSLDADSRIPTTPRTLAAVGWDHDVDQLSATLMLPPGYGLLHASGVDTATSTWITRWNLLSIFFVLLMTVVSLRLFGPSGAALALATLVLVWNEAGAPAQIWLALAVVEALRRAVASGRFGRAVAGVQGVVAIVFVVIAVPFAIAQLRGGLFPALARPDEMVAPFANQDMSGGAGGMASEEAVMATAALEAESAAVMATSDGAAAPSAMPVSPAAGELAMADARAEAKHDERVAMPGKAGARFARERRRYADSYGGGAYSSLSTRLDADPSAVIPTGPGRPDWSWEPVGLAWSGPVTRDQVVGLWLIPPWANALLAIARVVLVAALAGLFARGWRRELGGRDALGPLGLSFVRALSLGGAIAALFVVASTTSPAVARADMPTPELLEQLRTRLLEPPRCLPNCALLSRLELAIEPTRLRLTATIEAREETGVPLPGGGAGETSWLPATVRVDGESSAALRRDANGVLWLRVGRGAHTVVLEGALPARESVSITLPLAPRRTLVAGPARGWSVVGLGPEGQATGALSLVRDASAASAATVAKGGADEANGARAKDELGPSVILPFVALTRQLEVGLRWQSQTFVRRIAPVDGPVVLEVPLLAGESVTTPGIRVENGKAKLTLAAGESELAYQSTLEIAPKIELAAPGDAPWSEVWQLAAAPIWHVEAEGLPPVDLLHEGARVREWRPWPGEKLRLAVERPDGLEAATRTLDRVRLALTPGARATDATLTLTLRSSQGGQHALTLPEAAQLTSLAVDGAPQPLRQEARQVVVALSPGSHQVELGWREERGIAALFRSSEVGLGAPAVNASVEMHVPENRWLLYAMGPRLGPSILFWSTAIVVAGLAFLLARIRIAPLGLREWLLLGIGLTQAPPFASALVVAWFVVLGLRGRLAESIRRLRPVFFRMLQLALGALTLAAAGALIDAIATGLLGTPDMRVAGNGSSGQLLRWYVDRSAESLPQPAMLSLSLWWYRGAMLAWSLWLALALVEWARWAFAQWSRGGIMTPEAPVGAADTGTGA